MANWVEAVGRIAVGVVCVSLVACSAKEPAEPVEKDAPRAAPRAADVKPTLRASFDGCGLLENPDVRLRMSDALERKLRFMCEGAPGVEAAREQHVLGAEKPATETLAAPFAGTDILINDPALDVGGTTQSETSVAAFGNVVCAAWNDSGEGVGTAAFSGFSGFGVSSDGGQTFSDRGPIPLGTGGDTNFGDPSLAYSVRDGVFYYAALSSIGLSLWRSVNDCQTFEYVGPIHAGNGDDKELIFVDNTPSSPFYGRIHVGWTDFNAFPDLNVTSYSDDGGLTWSPTVTLFGSGFAGQGMWPAVAPNGDVYMALVNRSTGPGGTQDQWIYKSVDGGNTYVQATDIGTDQLSPEDAASSSDCGRQALNGHVRNLSSPQIVIGPDATAPAGYVIHSVYPYDSDGAGADASNVFYRRSVDGAATWSAEIKLNDDATTTDQWFPALGISETGNLVASWYDRRLDPTLNLAFDRFLTSSTDGGFTWSANERLSDVSSPVAQTLPNFDVFIAQCYHGDYDQLVVTGSVAHVVWSDDRRVTGTGPNPDVYYDQFVVNPSLGRLRADSGVVNCSGEINFTLSDQDLAGAGSQAISIVTTGGDSETLLLLEDAGTPGTFRGSIDTSPAAVSTGNGVLEIAHGQTITGTYNDADDGEGNPAVSTAVINADCAGPVISNVRVEKLRGFGGTVVVDLNEPGDLEVEYGLDCGALTSVESTPARSLSPNVILDELDPVRTYFFAVTSTDAGGNSTRDDNGGSCYSFTTLGLVYEEKFEGGLGGFTIDNSSGVGNGLWHLSESCASRTLGHSLTTTLYYGQDATCDYNNGVENEGTATSPVIHLTDASAGVLEMNFFLGTEGGGFFDQASVEVSVDGGDFVTVESNFTLNSVPVARRGVPVRRRAGAVAAGFDELVENTANWLHVVSDLTPLLEGLTDADIELRFRFNTIDSILNDFAGFYADDVQIWSIIPPEPCTTDADCNDGLLCSGVERCVGGFCRNGAPFVCESDGVDCTDTRCDEAAQGCVNIPNDFLCRDGLDCNGNETCDPTAGCQPATEPIVCAPDGIDCTNEFCSEALKGCEPIPDHAFCDDGLFCSGNDVCDVNVGCIVFPIDCNDGADCTTDVCDEEQNGCVWTPDDTVCQDGLFCTGEEFCQTFYGCVTPGDPCIAPAVCDEEADECIDCATDTTPPVFTFVPADITTTVCGSLDIGLATATDACDVTIANNAPAVFPPGTTVVTWSATDVAGNVTTATQKVTVMLTSNAACCPAGTNVIIGTSNNNTLNGTNGPDCILALGGQDIVNGNGGDDFISGGDGNDNINGGTGNDVVFGGSGQDTLNGGTTGNDTMYGDDGDDTLLGGAGNDTLFGGQGQDSVQGQDGADLLVGDSGDDNLQGGAGNDNLVGGANNDTCNGGTGTNTFATCEFGAPNSCASGTQNGTETGVDCGGACPDCGAGSGCVSGGDCQGGLFCVGGTCTAGGGGGGGNEVTTSIVFTTDWGAGYCTTLEVTNNTTQTASSFAVTLDTNASTITSSWNGTFSGSSGEITVTPCCSWNATLSPGETDSSIGFCANRTVPTSGTLPFVISTTGTF